MPTFFEKLTGNQGEPEPIAETASVRTPLRPQKKVHHEEPQAMHLRVEAEEQKPETQAEAEEGELTVDIYDKGDTIVIQSTVAGVKPEELDVSITNDSVTIRGRRERHEEVSEKDYYYKELFWGSFSRTVILPEEIDEDMAEATLKHGLLTIKLPKKRRGVVQKLKVKIV